MVESSDFVLGAEAISLAHRLPGGLWGRATPNAGFDIVLANPPYVRQEKLDAEDQRSYEEAFPEVHTGTSDILVYFYARALQILRPGGWLSFITSNKFMRADYGTGIREHLPDSLCIQRVIDFGDLPLFEANGRAIAAYPAVLVGNRSDDTVKNALKAADLAGPVRKALSDDALKVNTESVRGVLEDLDGLLARAEISDFPQVMLKKDGWILEDPALVRLFERLMKQGTPLREFVKGRIHYGVKTGRDKAFVIGQAKRDELVEDDPRNAEIIKAVATRQGTSSGGGQIGRDCMWSSRVAGIDIDQYPAIKDHLIVVPRSDSRAQSRYQWTECTRGRKPGDYQWYEIARLCCIYHGEFVHPIRLCGRHI